MPKKCPCIDLNEACDSGNTALHAAVNKGNLCLVEILLRANEDSNNSSGQQEQRLKSPSLTSASTSTSSSSTSTTTDATLASSGPRLDVNRANLKCMNATPLHLAVWNNYDEIALRLIEAKADPMLKMNGQSSAYDLARENNNQALADLMLEFSRRYLLTQDDDQNDNRWYNYIINISKRWFIKKTRIYSTNFLFDFDFSSFLFFRVLFFDITKTFINIYI